jgi:HSP20 family protein
VPGAETRIGSIEDREIKRRVVMARKESSALSTWDPFREMGLLREFSPFRGVPGFGSLLEEAPARWAPSVDIVEDDDQYVVTVELAGASKEDVNVEMLDNVLTIRGEKKSEREENDEHRRYVERSYGSFSRSFSLPANAHGDEINAIFGEGVLTIEIPKREEAKAKTIAVK